MTHIQVLRKFPIKAPHKLLLGLPAAIDPDQTMEIKFALELLAPLIVQNDPHRAIAWPQFEQWSQLTSGHATLRGLSAQWKDFGKLFVQWAIDRPSFAHRQLVGKVPARLYTAWENSCKTSYQGLAKVLLVRGVILAVAGPTLLIFGMVGGAAVVTLIQAIIGLF